MASGQSPGGQQAARKGDAGTLSPSRTRFPRVSSHLSSFHSSRKLGLAPSSPHPGPARPTLCPCPGQWGPCKGDGAQTERAQYLSLKQEVQAYVGSGDRPLSTSAALSVCLHRQVSSLTLRPETKAPRQGVCPGSQITPTGPKLQPGPASETSQHQV